MNIDRAIPRIEVATAFGGTPKIGDFWYDTTNLVMYMWNGSAWVLPGEDYFDFLVGSAIDTPSVSASSNGSTITFSLEKSGTGDVRFYFSDGIHTHDCTPAATVSLTAGSDTSPQINYVYILKSNKTLTVSTTSWPSAEHAPLATVLCQSAASAQTDGLYKFHAWTDHISGSSDSLGHLAHLNYWIRQQNATWVSGVAITPSVGAATFDVATSSGTILQLHQHAYPAFDTSTGSEVMLVNDSATAYSRVGNLVSQLTDANGVSMSGRYYNLVFWGVVSEATGDCQLMVNLPTASYVSEAPAIADDDATAVYTIPSDFRGTGFLIARLTVRHQVSGNTYSISQNEDLRGLYPATAPGGGTPSVNDFPDNTFSVYDESDPTKILAFQCSGITTGNTRTMTVPDSSGTLLLAGGVDAGTDITAGTLATARGGTGLTTYADGDLVYGLSTALVKRTVGTKREVLRVDSTTTLPNWDATLFTATSAPAASVQSGDAYYNTTDETLYMYDATRSKWLGGEFAVSLGNLSTVNPGYLRVGNNVHTTTLGLTLPYDMTLVAASFNNSNSVTVVIDFDAGASTSGSMTCTTADNVSSTSLDIDFSAGDEFKVYINTASSGTPQNVSVMCIFKRRSS